MPDNAAIVTNWLRARSGQYFCQSCISDSTGVEPKNQVNQIVRPLREAREWVYADAPCANCGHHRKCIMFRG